MFGNIVGQVKHQLPTNRLTRFKVFLRCLSTNVFCVVGLLRLSPDLAHATVWCLLSTSRTFSCLAVKSPLVQCPFVRRLPAALYLSSGVLSLGLCSFRLGFLVFLHGGLAALRVSWFLDSFLPFMLPGFLPHSSTKLLVICLSFSVLINLEFFCQSEMDLD